MTTLFLYRNMLHKNVHTYNVIICNWWTKSWTQKQEIRYNFEVFSIYYEILIFQSLQLEISESLDSLIWN